MRFKYFSAAVSSKSFKNILCKDDNGRTYTVRVVCYGKGAGGGGVGGGIIHCKQTAEKGGEAAAEYCVFLCLNIVFTIVKICLI